MRASRNTLSALLANLLLMAAILSSILVDARVDAQMVTSAKMPGYADTIKFACPVSDDKRPVHELATDRSVSITNSITFHDDWKTHWANELEFSVKP